MSRIILGYSVVVLLLLIRVVHVQNHLSHSLHNRVENNREILVLPGKQPCFHPVFGPPFTPYPLFQWYLQSRDILINLSMKCPYSAFNAQGSRLIIVVVQLGAMKIYVAAVEKLQKQGR